MKHEYIKSSPTFFQLILRAMGAACVFLVTLALLIPAPLQEAADMSEVPNPAHSGWFLLWMQELVSYSNAFIYLIIALGVFFGMLPWLPRTRPAEKAQWFSRDQGIINSITLISFAGILVLTVIALYFRGENWSFVLPF
ncbi:hypothetical protein Selin_2604 [Desulfurispirillum indicum S5]|uniref:Cytochrome B6 n=2 Tax=Desulfurispirillum TaxID=393029 RepID=E6W6I0_DESIS|nr:hypothetical protein Selin_2604 [Desulfurispirillum indicum S5]